MSTAARSGRQAFSRRGVEPDAYEVTFSEHRAEFVRRDGDLTTTLDVVVSAECDAEVRRVSSRTSGDRVRTIEVTSYAELVLAPRAADEAHPAFSKLFVQTEYLPAIGALLATRRRRSPEEPEVWAAHLAVVEGDSVGRRPVRNRPRPLHRARSASACAGRASTGGPLAAGTVGTVLDPIFSLTPPRASRARAPPRASRSGRWSRRRAKKLLDLVDQHRDPPAFDRAVTLAWTQAQVAAAPPRHRPGRGDALPAPGRSPALQRSGAAPVVRRASAPQRSGSRHSGPMAFPATCRSCCSGSTTRRSRHRATVAACPRILAHEAAAVDLVILNERSSSYVQDLQSALESLTRAGLSRAQDPRRVGARRRVHPALRPHLRAKRAWPCWPQRAPCCSVVTAASPSNSIGWSRTAPAVPPPSSGVRSRRDSPDAPPDVPTLEFFNGLGGFTDDGEEYVTVLRRRSVDARALDQRRSPIPPSASRSRPMAVAAPGRATAARTSSRPGRTIRSAIVRAKPSTCTTTTPACCSGPTALPIRDANGEYLARHGRGYSRFEHTRARHRARPAAVRPARRTGQGLAPADSQPLRSHASPDADGLR